MAIVPLGGERFIDTATGKTFSTTGGGYFAGESQAASGNVDAKAFVPSTSSSATPSSASATSVKIATPDIMIGKDEAVPVEIMTNLIFEDIGGQEIINIARTDLVNGQKVVYQPIKNLSDINSQYNSNNIMSLENTSETVFNNFPIRLDTHVPDYSLSDSPNVPVYIDTDGNLVIEVINMETGEQVEVEILNSGIKLNDTIY